MIFKSKIALESLLGYVKNFIFYIEYIELNLIISYYSNFFPISAYTIIAYIYIYIHKITVRTFQYIYIYIYDNNSNGFNSLH